MDLAWRSPPSLAVWPPSQEIWADLSRAPRYEVWRHQPRRDRQRGEYERGPNNGGHFLKRLFCLRYNGASHSDKIEIRWDPVDSYSFLLHDKHAAWIFLLDDAAVVLTSTIKTGITPAKDGIEFFEY